MVGVNLLSVHAPERSNAAFREWRARRKNKVLIVNRAITFAQESSTSRGRRAPMIEIGPGRSKDEKILQAQGTPSPSPCVRRIPPGARPHALRLHLEALEEVLPPPRRSCARRAT